MGWDLCGIDLLVRIVVSVVIAVIAVGCLLVAVYKMGVSQGKIEKVDQQMDKDGL